MNIKNSVSNMSFKGYGVELRPVAITDLLSLRRWRNNPNVRGKMVNKSYLALRKLLDENFREFWKKSNSWQDR